MIYGKKGVIRLPLTLNGVLTRRLKRHNATKKKEDVIHKYFLLCKNIYY